MPPSSPPSRRRLTVDGSSGRSHTFDSFGLAARKTEASNSSNSNSNINIDIININNDDGDDGETQNPYQTSRKRNRNRNRNCNHCRPGPWLSPVTSFSFPTRRTALAIIIVLAMAGVGVGIMVGIFVVLSPEKPQPRFVTVERSNYTYNYAYDYSYSYNYKNKPNGNTKGGTRATTNTVVSDGASNIVLGKLPPPLDVEGKAVYHPSSLESYVIDNGRTGLKLGYNRQIAPYLPAKSNSPRTLEDAVSSNFFGHLLNFRPPKTTFVDYTDGANTRDLPSGCELWTNPEVTTPEIYHQFQDFRMDLEAYERSLSDWTWTWEPPKRVGSLWDWNYLSGAANTNAKANKNENENTHTESSSSSSSSSNDASDDANRRKHDLRDFMDKAVCESLEVHPEGLWGIFTSPLSLSKLPSSGNEDGSSAYLEPFLPPLRHPEFCYVNYDIEKLREHRANHEKANKNRNKRKNKQKQNADETVGKNHRISDTGYIVHDFAAMCRNNLHKHSQTVFVDIGESFGFRSSHSREPLPTLALLRLYQRFGFVFDHIYGYGVTTKDSSEIFRDIPDDLKASYHWFNVSADSDPSSHANPFRLISEHFTPDDFVVVKLDIGMPGIENPLAHQLLMMEEFELELELEKVTPPQKPPFRFRHKLSDLIDVFYFDHHFAMKELAVPWNDSMRGSMQDSMEFFTSLRQHGIAAHYWI